jgi:hypothetical protein
MCMRQLHDEFRVQPMPNARDQRLKQRHCRMLDLARNLVQSEPDALADAPVGGGFSFKVKVTVLMTRV